MYANLESLITRIDRCKNSFEKPSTTKSGEFIPCGNSISMTWTMNCTEKQHIYRCEECMNKFWEYLREHAMKIIKFIKKKMKPLKIEQQESYEKAKIC